MKKIKIIVGLSDDIKYAIENDLSYFRKEDICCRISMIKTDTIETSACEITYIDTTCGKPPTFDIEHRYNPDVCYGSINIPKKIYLINRDDFYGFVKLQNKSFNNYYESLTMEEVGYCKNDVEMIKANYAKELEFDIKKVIFNDPATIVLWNDGTKTVVKAQEDNDFNEMVGLAMAISKKAFGNKGNYYEIFKKWVPEPKKNLFDWGTSVAEALVRINQFKKMMQNVKNVKEYDEQMRKVQSLASATKEAMEKYTTKEPLKVGSYASQYKFDRITRSNKLVKNLYGGCCPNCGQNVNDTYEYCQNCGQKLDWTKWKDKEDE